MSGKGAAAAAVAPPASPAAVARPPKGGAAAASPPSAVARARAWWSTYTLGEQVQLAWFALDALTHLVLEASFLWFACLVPGGAAASSHFMASTWKIYARADARWAMPWETGTVAVELPTVFIAGPVAAALVWAVATRRPWRHLAVSLLSWLELIGGWYTFAPEWLTGSPNLHTADPVHLYIYLGFMNLLWVLIPAVLMVDSGRRILAACAAAEGAKPGPAGVSDTTWKVCVASLVAYVILVPAALMRAK